MIFFRAKSSQGFWFFFERKVNDFFFTAKSSQVFRANSSQDLKNHKAFFEPCKFLALKSHKGIALWFFERKSHKAMIFFRVKSSQKVCLAIFSSEKFTRLLYACDFFRAKSSQGLMIFVEQKVKRLYIALRFFSSKKFTRPCDFFRAKSSQGLMNFVEC